MSLILFQAQLVLVLVLVLVQVLGARHWAWACC